MGRKELLLLTAAMSALTLTLFVLIGCGGSGGPIVTPPPRQPGQSEQFLQLLPAAQRTATYVGSDRCGDCHGGGHGGGTGKIDVAAFNDTLHSQAGLGCESCHGPASIHNANPTKDNILTYPLVTRTAVCAQCHGPKSAAYDISKHAEIVESVKEEAETNPAVYGKNCFRCHSAAFRTQYVDAKLSSGMSRDDVNAGIVALSDQEIIRTAQLSQESATCVNCHEPHKKTGNLTEAGKDKHLLRKVFSMDGTSISPGAPIAQHTTVDHMCGTCHNSRGGRNDDASINSSTARPPFHNGPQFNMLLGIGGVEGTGPPVRTTAHSDAPGQCVHCHMPQGRHSFTTSFDTSCQPCHTPGDADARSAIKGAIELQLFSLRTRMENWARARFGDSDMWDYTSLIAAKQKTAPPQAQVPIEIKRARHNYYFILRDQSLGIHNSAYTRHLLNVANQNLDSLGVGRAAPLPPGRSPDYIRRVLQEDIRIGNIAARSEKD